MYFLLGICLVLAFLLALNILASISASLLWRIVSKPAKNLSSRKQAQIIFAFRTFPMGAAFIFVLAFLLPSYVLFEPQASGEVVSVKLAVISLLSILGVAIAASRIFRTRSVTRKLIADWLVHSKPISVDGVNIPVYRMQHPFPVIGVVGILRPRLFVAEQIFDLLSPDQFRAAIAHEHGHLKAHDNFKRAFMRVCRDTLIFSVGRELDNAWADKIEAAADEHAAATGGNEMAIGLAEALIKLARIAPANARPAMPLGLFLINGRENGLTQRVRRLLKLADRKTMPEKGSLLRSRPAAWLYAGLVFSGVLLLASNKQLLFAVHNLSEQIMAALQ